MSERSTARAVSAKPKPARPFPRRAAARKAAHSRAGSQHPATRFTSSTPGQGWEPGIGANVLSHPQTLHDPIRFFSRVTDSQFDSVRR